MKKKSHAFTEKAIGYGYSKRLLAATIKYAANIVPNIGVSSICGKYVGIILLCFSRSNNLLYIIILFWCIYTLWLDNVTVFLFIFFKKRLIMRVLIICLFLFSTSQLTAQVHKADSVKTKEQAKIKEPEAKPVDKKVNPWKSSFAIGLSASNFMEFNAKPGPDKKNFSGTGSIDLGLNRKKEDGKLEMTNEVHWMVGVQRAGLSDSGHLQRVADDLKTLHDISYGISKGNKFSINLIARTSTSIFTIYNGDYFTNVNHAERIQGFLNPWEATLAPGIKLQPDKFLRVSVSPFSVYLYGVESQRIANTRHYTHDSDVNHNYVRFVAKQLGAEINVWYDRQIGKWLGIQYRIGASADYFDKIGEKGKLDGLFITKVKLLKDLYLSHRAELKGDFAEKKFKPYYSQTILLSFTKSL